ncbi:alpha/beta hydrolase [Leuconostocaceae bacterium ESL0723]|nr:alpha/beta hydrolase [Leuconostocaceae bacterium ESL0723]
MKRSRLILLIGVILLIVISSFSWSWMSRQHNNDRAIQNARIQPVIFVPGSGATVNRFDDLFTALEKDNPRQKTSVLKVKVNKDNSISYTGTLNKTARNPYIVIGFQDNSDSYANIKRQAKWLSLAMNDLQRKYHFRDFSAVGHSNGGLDWTDYLENYYSSYHFHMRTLMTLGTPYNFSESSVTRQTNMLTDLIDNAGNLPSDLTVYSVAGSEDYTDDGTVPVQSVLSGKYIFQKNVKAYTQITVSGNNAAHSSLPENPEVVQLIEEYVLKTGNNGTNGTNRRQGLRQANRADN